MIIKFLIILVFTITIIIIMFIMKIDTQRCTQSWLTKSEQRILLIEGSYNYIFL